jgi:hypothetical protein
MSGRQKDDWYPTPPLATRRLVDVELFDEVIWEPAAGDGAIAKELQTACYEVISSDLNDYGYCPAGIDFLLEQRRAADSIVTNPPYKLAEQFIRHAIDLRVQKHAWLLRLSFLEGQKRHQRLLRDHPPSFVHVFSQRLTMWRGDEEATGSSGTTAYAWFVWQRGYTGRPQLGWL